MTNIEKALQDIKSGKMVIVTDDTSRENEGDLVMAAEFVTPEAILFMKKYGRGMINLCVDQSIAKRLNLMPMVSENTARFGTNFTISIDAKKGTTTGSSAHDHARTILKAVDPKSIPEDFARPGHVLPLVAHHRGVWGREGHTESTTDLARLAGLEPTGVLCEIMGADGHMAQQEEIEMLAQDHRLTVVTVNEIIEYRFMQELCVKKIVSTSLPTKYGKFTMHLYRDCVNNQEHAVLKMDKEGGTPPDTQMLTRIHSSCVTGDIFGSSRCDCQDQLHLALEEISKNGEGVLIYLDQEGRGIGLEAKLKAYNLQDHGRDTVEANIELGFKADERRFWVAAHILKDLGVTSVKLMTNNPEKITDLEMFGISVERETHWTGESKCNQAYLNTKKEKMGHLV